MDSGLVLRDAVDTLPDMIFYTGQFQRVRDECLQCFGVHRGQKRGKLTVRAALLQDLSDVLLEGMVNCLIIRMVLRFGHNVRHYRVDVV
jgi:hypothetical protein